MSHRDRRGPIMQLPIAGKRRPMRFGHGVLWSIIYALAAGAVIAVLGIFLLPASMCAGLYLGPLAVAVVYGKAGEVSGRAFLLLLATCVGIGLAAGAFQWMFCALATQWGWGQTISSFAEHCGKNDIQATICAGIFFSLFLTIFLGGWLWLERRKIR